MPYKDFQYVVEKEQLPDLNDNSTCPICYESILDRVIDENGDEKHISDLENNCVICENGHRLHRTCYFKMKQMTCPLCNGEVEQMCCGFNRELGEEAYSYHPRKGGRYKKHKTLKRKRSSKKHRKNTNKSKKNKRTRYHRKSKK
jgi:hypothetical protein